MGINGPGINQAVVLPHVLEQTFPGLNSASPLIDAGLSGVENCEHFKNEPAPNGCAANLGAYGNTAEAASKAGAPHCECP